MEAKERIVVTGDRKKPDNVPVWEDWVGFSILDCINKQAIQLLSFSWHGHLSSACQWDLKWESQYKEKSQDHRNTHTHNAWMAQTCYSILYGLFISWAHIAKPTCAHSFDLQPLQNGIPSIMSTVMSFRKILSCNITFLSWIKSFITIGIVGTYLSFVFSQRAKAVTPSLTLLFLIMLAITFADLFFFSSLNTLSSLPLVGVDYFAC